MGADKQTENVLVVQLADLGDLLLAAPAIQQFRQVFPARRVTLLTKPGNLPLAQKLADEVLVFDKHLYDRPVALLNPLALLKALKLVIELRRHKFEEVILLHHLVTRWGAAKFAALSWLSGAPFRRGLDNGRGWFLTESVHDRGFGAESEREYWEELLGGADGIVRFDDPEPVTRDRFRLRTPYAVIHPGSGSYSTARRWPLEHFLELADGLHRDLGLRVVVVGGLDEACLGKRIVQETDDQAINLCGETDLPSLVRVLEGAEMFIGNDGGVAQLAGLVETPGIVIFGPTSPKTWLPHGSRLRAVQIDLPCAPCFYRYAELGTPGGCSTRECLVDLPPSRILEEAMDVMSAVRAA